MDLVQLMEKTAYTCFRFSDYQEDLQNTLQHNRRFRESRRLADASTRRNVVCVLGKEVEQ